MESSEGMFLWASLAWETFLQGVVFWNPVLVQERYTQLQSLPRGLDSLYERMVERIPDETRHDTIQILIWLAAAQRPLKLSEIAFLLAIEGFHTSFSELRAYLASNISGAIKTHYGSFTHIRKDSSVTLVHKSMKDFLLTAL